MNLKWVHIKNYRSCNDVEIDFSSIHAFVGSNNAGKSTILRALDFLFNPSTSKVDNETFWNGDTSCSIWIEAIFDNLNDPEKELLKAYLRPDDTFHIARSCKCKHQQETNASDKEEDFSINHHYCAPMPVYEWLQDAKIKKKAIDEWWTDKNSFVANGHSFGNFIGTRKPNVGEWKNKAKEFSETYLCEEDFKDTWNDNPTGYANILKSILPKFLLIPAVRDIKEEAKVTKTNPFGQILYEILGNITEEQTTSFNKILENLKKKLNRVGGATRLSTISTTEARLNKFLQEYMPGDLEIEFQPPTLKMLLTTPLLFVDDGFRNIAENKGHGLQRAIIFSILRCYAELVTGSGVQKKRNVIFAIEEPEIYMHPQAQRTIRRVFREIAKKTDQVFFTTHSSLLLDVAYFDEIIRVESFQETIDNKKTIKSKVWQLPIINMINDIRKRRPGINNVTKNSIRELYSNACYPVGSEGFFAKKIILVEGPTEQYALPIYAEALENSIYLDHLNISIVDSGGKGQLDRLYRVYNELGIPCYIIFDYDDGNNEPNIIEKSKELLRMFNESPDCSQSVFVGDNIAYFPKKWEVTLAEEVAKYDELKANAKADLGLSKGAGKPLIARYIARELTSERQANKFVPASIKKILETAVKVKWEKSCLEL